MFDTRFSFTGMVNASTLYIIQHHLFLAPLLFSCFDLVFLLFLILELGHSLEISLSLSLSLFIFLEEFDIFVVYLTTI